MKTFARQSISRKYLINSSITLKREKTHDTAASSLVRRAYASRVCQSRFNTDNDSSVTAEPNRGKLGREADRVGGSGNGSNHGRIRVELSRRRIIIVSWHRSVVPFPAHRFSFLVSRQPRARSSLFHRSCCTDKEQNNGCDSAQTDAARWTDALYDDAESDEDQNAQNERWDAARLKNPTLRLSRVSSLAIVIWILWLI